MDVPRKMLFVCLGNICRSPTAEGVLKYLSGQQHPPLDLEVDSAGTGAYHIGAPPDPRAQRAALARGIDLSGLRARQIAPADFAHFDVILAMDRQNLRDLEKLRPPQAPAPALFLEYAGLPAPLEVPDPYSGDAEDFDQVLDLVTRGARALIERLKS